MYELHNWISEITEHMINFTQVSLIYFTHWAGSNDLIRSFLFKSLLQLPIRTRIEHGLFITVTISFRSNCCSFYLSTYSWIIARIFLIYWLFLRIFMSLFLLMKNVGFLYVFAQDFYQDNSDLIKWVGSCFFIFHFLEVFVQN